MCFCPCLRCQCIMPSPVYLTTVGLSTSLLFYYAYLQISRLIVSRKYSRTHGTKPAEADRHWDPFLGLDLVISTIFAGRGNHQLQNLQDRFNRISHTFTSDVLGDKVVFTDEFKNAQAVLAAQFLTLESSADRPRQATVKLLGHGIFNADGTYWEHSRALIRPNFVKQVGDLKFMEHHVMTMVNQLPGDGSRVNIQEFFFRMVCIASSTIFVIPFLGSFEDR